LHDRRYFTGKFSRQIAKRSDACGQRVAGMRVQRHSPRACLLDRRASRGETGNDSGKHVSGYFLQYARRTPPRLRYWAAAAGIDLSASSPSVVGFRPALPNLRHG
jgi:hypothetical protein